MRELSPLAIFLGVIIGILFGAANAYIGMKVGMTVSASIPAAVISMAILRGILKRGTIGENNMVQTIGSVGESLAAGMIFTIPALFVFAYKDANPELQPELMEMAVWGGIGGLIGVIFMVPLRRMLIVREHGKLPYPEGTACAEVLESGAQGGSAARTVFAGLGVGAIYEFFRGLGFWKDEATLRLPYIKSEFGLSAEPALLGVGYILGIRIAGYMLAGAVLGWFVIIPAIGFFGGPDTVIAPSEVALGEMDPGDMWNTYLRYIGAGAVVLGGLLSLFKSFGTIGSSVFHMIGGSSTGQRTDRDIPVIILLVLLGGLGAAMWFAPEYGLMNKFLQSIPVIACVLVFGFFFVTVSSRLVGIVGSSSNPASGMTIATLLGTALILVYVVGVTGPEAKITIISVGALVCIAICIAGDCSQDLKTGYLVKATPWKQQFGEIIGVLTAAGALAAVIWICNDRYGFFRDAAHPNALLAPQANLMQLLVQGIVDANLPWELILIGMACALIVEFLGIPSLPFAVGLYLPLSLSTPIMVGGVINWLVTRTRKQKATEAQDPGILASSGLVAGHGLMGVMMVGAAALIGFGFGDPRFAPPKYNEQGEHWGQLDKDSGLFVYEDENMGGVGYHDKKSGAWVTYDEERGGWGYDDVGRGWMQYEPVVEHLTYVDPDRETRGYHDESRGGVWVHFNEQRDAWAYFSRSDGWVEYVPEVNAWVYESREHGTRGFEGPSDRWIYYNEEEEQWGDMNDEGKWREFPAQARAPKDELVVPKHFFPWLSTKFAFVDPEYGLRKLKYEQMREDADGNLVAGPFSGEYAIDWYHLLPLGPFLLLALWLAAVAGKRLPPPEPTTAAPVPSPLPEKPDQLVASAAEARSTPLFEPGQSMTDESPQMDLPDDERDSP